MLESPSNSGLEELDSLLEANTRFLSGDWRVILGLEEVNQSELRHGPDGDF